MTWSRVVNPEAPNKQPPPTSQVCPLLTDLLLPFCKVSPDASSGLIVAWHPSTETHKGSYCAMPAPPIDERGSEPG